MDKIEEIREIEKYLEESGCHEGAELARKAREAIESYRNRARKYICK